MTVVSALLHDYPLGDLGDQVYQVRPFTNHYTITLLHVSVAVHPTEVTRSNSDLVQSTAHCNITLVMSTRLAIVY